MSTMMEVSERQGERNGVLVNFTLFFQEKDTHAHTDTQKQQNMTGELTIKAERFTSN